MKLNHLLLPILLSVTVAGHAEVYRWVDEQGNTKTFITSEVEHEKCWQNNHFEPKRSTPDNAG